MQLDNPLWHYISAVYSQAEIETLCLELQDHGLQVNSVLCCIWLAQQQKRYDPLMFDVAQQPWRKKFLRPFREMRYALRLEKVRQTMLSSCYESMKDTELAMEQVDIALLWQSSNHLTQLDKPLSVDTLALDNLEIYIQSENVMNPDVCHVSCRSLVSRLC